MSTNKLSDLEILDRFMFAFGKSPTIKQWYKLRGIKKERLIGSDYVKYSSLLEILGFDKPTRSDSIRIYDTRDRLAYCGTMQRAIDIYPFLTVAILKHGLNGYKAYCNYRIEKVDIDKEMWNVLDSSFWETDRYKYKGKLNEDDKYDY